MKDWQSPFKKHFMKGRSLWIYAAGALCALSLMVAIEHDALFVLATRVQEDAMDAFFPSAERYYAYGDRHFNGTAGTGDYDIGRAQYMYEHALALDPDLPYVYHQLARVAFIEGDLPKALDLIDIQIARHGDATPSSYYVRGLIEGYMGDYAHSVQDYKEFNQLEPDQWPGINDYAWALLKDNDPEEAVAVTDEGLKKYPNNPWLLNSNATALYEIGDRAGARASILEAYRYVQNITPEDWSKADPGNSPEIAYEGLQTLRKAVADNMHTITDSTKL